MIHRVLYTLLVLALLAPAGRDVSVDVDVQVLQTTTPQMTSLQPISNSPCHCKTSLGLGCSISSPMGLSSCSARLNTPGKLTFLALRTRALKGNKRPVPLPPPKI